MDTIYQSPHTDGFRIDLEQVDLHRLDLRYAHTRVISPQCLRALCASLEELGQISPLVSTGSLVLIDGYRRVEALRRNRKDTAMVEIWPCTEQQALVRLMARPRRWEAIEEAALLREILHDSHLCRAQLARLVGKDPSWVTRRLDLLDSLSQDLLGLIRSGHLSSWVASRVIAPLARANADHALGLAIYIAKEGPSSRDLVSWLDHYHRSNHPTREKMVKDPGLFIKAVHAKAEQRQAYQLRQGPEGRWLSDLDSILKILEQRGKEAALLCGTDLGAIRQSLHKIQARLGNLVEQIERIAPHGEPANQTNDPGPASGQHLHPCNQQDPQDI